MRRAPLLALALLPLGSLAPAETLTAFHAPSDNIHCLHVEDAEGNFVDCEILETDSAEPLVPRPSDCDQGWGHRFLVEDVGPARMVCAGDTVQDPAGAVLPHGQGIRFGAVTCASSEEGLECRNAEGYGFFLSRAMQQVF